ncbi:VOC family protein [uncultured Litoreibacter sp.]|uniref:VOC family protein n=1 Tax=uncultured Litoreibacter sp. TaxID=1392394 RepID=UPI00261DADEF|nr:VOC family protein [uncultured Litoreibacter sp.]
MSETHGTVHWTELNTHDVDKAIAYYTKLCGWSFDKMPMEGADYHIAMKGDQMVAGMFDLAAMPEMKDLPSHWLTYLAVEDVDAAAKDTEALGGTIIRAPWDVEGVGRIAILTDPSGAAFGMMTPS